jgi:phosphomevalonate kinase
MNETVVARAPGKLFVLGEYAVLDGCPAIVAAIDRHVEVAVQRTPRATRVRVCAPACAAADFPTLHPPVIEGPLRFVVAGFAAALSQCREIGQQGWSLTITGTMVGPDGAKIGLGSSAAVTTATIAALLAAARKDVSRDDLFAAALAAHRKAQEDVGSGADVAASVYGGLVLFQPRERSLPAVTPLTLPSHTKLLVAWTGESASTPGLVKHYLAARNGAAPARAAFLYASRTYVAAFVSALRQGRLSHVAIDGNGAALARLGERLGLPVVTPRLARLVAIARSHGAAAKISGAGSGDCGIALTRNATAAEEIRSAWRAAGLVPLDVALDPTGVTVGRR